MAEQNKMASIYSLKPKSKELANQKKIYNTIILAVKHNKDVHTKEKALTKRHQYKRTDKDTNVTHKCKSKSNPKVSK